MLDPRRHGADLERRRRADQGLPRRRDHRPALLALLSARGARARPARARARGSRAPTARSRTKAGASARTARGSGPTSSSPRCATPAARSSASPRSRATSPSGAATKRRCARARSASGCSSKASPDYAIFMLDANGHVATWNAGAERIKGYARRRDHRPALLGLLSAPRPRRAAGPSTSCRWPPRRALRGRGLAACARTARSSGPTS